MKKIISLALSILMLFGVISLAGCGKAETLKLGLGVTSYAEKVTNADADTNGTAKTVTTVSAVLLDKDDKIVKCVIDAADNTLEFTSNGKFTAATEFKTKYEAGKDYGMVAYGGAKKEWFEQVDAFTSLVVGKTIDEVKALVATNNKGTEDVINAGCTIIISDFVKAIEKAVKAATNSNATADSKLQLGIVSAQGANKDATEEAEGTNKVETNISACAIDNDGKLIATKTDSVETSVAFNAKGIASTKSGAEYTTKYEAKENYGMAAYGQDLNEDGVVKEWFEQADAYNAACIGKNANEIAALAVETGYGVDTLQKAGCTINIGGIVKATVKAATV